MRDAEDVAREVDYATQDWDPGNGASEEDLARWADLIRARDDEVRAETLAGFTEEHRALRACGCVTSPGFAGACCILDAPALPDREERRLVGPWEPEP